MSEVEYLETIVKPLLENPEALEIVTKKDDRGILILLFVDKEDLGRTIGKQGETANSLRCLLRILGTKNNARYNLKVDSRKP